MNQKTGIAAALSLICALTSYFATFSGNPLIGFLLALVSIPLGILGVFMAASPRVSGGIMSIFAIILGGFGLAIALMGMVGVILL